MKRFSIAFLFSLCVFISSFPQTIEIPDNNFLQALIDIGVDSNNDNAISEEEAAHLTDLDVNYKNIEELSGIEFFINLTSLDCGDNTISNLNITNLTKLEYLWCQNNSLTALDVSKCPKLKVLSFNTNHINSINLENNPNIQWLDFSFTRVDSINLDALQLIETIACANSRIRNLIVPDKPNLEQIIASNCNIQSINVSNDASLKVLEINGNMIEELDLGSCSSIEYLGLRNMPLLSRICSPYLPFESESLTITTSGSPNIYFTECIAPSVVANKTEVSIGDTIEFSITEDGDFYLLSDSIVPDLHSLISDPIMHLNAEANKPFEIILQDTIHSFFCAYAVDLYDNISDPFCFIYNADSTETLIGESIPLISAHKVYSVYPNPVSDFLNLKAPGACQFSLRITDLNGQIIVREEINGNFRQLNLSSLKSGVYFLIIQSKDFVQIDKIMKH